MQRKTIRWRRISTFKAPKCSLTPDVRPRVQCWRGESRQAKKTRIDPQVDFDWADNKAPDAKFDDTETQAFTWPKGVRRYYYRKDPDLPAGNFPKGKRTTKEIK